MKQQIDYYYYIMTVKPYQDRSLLALENVMTKFKRCIPGSEYISDWWYEFDKCNRPHIHTLIQRPTEITKYQVVKDGFGCHYDEFPEYDYNRCLDYISKDGLTRDGALMLDMVYHEHMDSF